MRRLLLRRMLLRRMLLRRMLLRRMLLLLMLLLPRSELRTVVVCVQRSELGIPGPAFPHITLFLAAVAGRNQ